MRSFILIGIAILLLTGVAQADIGYISIWSSPDGGSIYVDGDYKGTTDSSQYITISTTPGYHTVEISKDGYDKYSTSVYVYSNQGTTVTAYLNPTFTPASNPTELQDQTNWKLVSTILALFLIGVVVLLVHKSKEGTHIEKLFPTKYAVAIGLGTVLILFLILYSVELGVFVLAIIIANGLVFGLDWIIRTFSITKSIVAIILISALALLLMWYFSFSECFVSGVIMVGIITGLVVGWVWILIRVIVWVIQAIAKAIRNRNYITKISERFKKLIKGETTYRPEHNEPPKKPTPEEKPLTLPMRMEYLQSKGIEKPTPEGKPRRKFKISWVILIMLLIVIGSIGYAVYQKYSPLAELANCGND
ncbi:MAG: PEGA domain-containing protein, partial [Candidatus Methanoperedens sp.]|nr:PEGA domain-containing protein [Candidatus Methanoperedens sp.]